MARGQRPGGLNLDRQAVASSVCPRRFGGIFRFWWPDPAGCLLGLYPGSAANKPAAAAKDLNHDGHVAACFSRFDISIRL